jgi:GR25 family glycosyltransferase involved in LPS biosynthesis
MSFKDTFFNELCLIINLDKSKDRFEFTYNNVKNAGFTNIQRFQAIDPSINDIDQIWKYFGSPKFDPTSPGFITQKGHQGCMLSHLLIWNKVIKENIERIIIFEDDIRFHTEWHNYINDYIKNTPVNFDILYLGSEMLQHSSQDVTTIPVVCFHAYMITLNGAKRLLNLILTCERGMYPIDCMITDHMYIHMKDQSYSPYIWYAWNGTILPTDAGKKDKPSRAKRNNGLVFQDDLFESQVSEFEK